ncbi:MAG: acylneuraminate cytidylyltransferase family protein [bacterium]|uniref:Acylneuraminate cytidylyltransferase family protein n=1 Tax=Candidatus Methylomirabilis tolerans TaxID=3123416 RepID=A0AAJ1AKC3_9BACT|nr:acylneuraminate cytidylyltransferase family protein [Candidatus Methylomirabilis sp.]
MAIGYAIAPMRVDRYPDLKILGIIGARSGSKGVPHKNIRLLMEKPLIAWIIETAKASRYVNRVIVSTDSEEYAAIARRYGADVPYLRPKELAADHSPEWEYVKHMVEWLMEYEQYKPDIVVRMMTTVPLQMPEDIDSCIEELLKDPLAQSAVVIAEARQHPLKALKLINDGKGGQHLVTYFTESGREVTPIARQHYEKAYFRSNVIACRTNVIYETASLTGDFVRYHIIPQERAIDIDSPIDFFIVEKLMEKFRNDGIFA